MHQLRQLKKTIEGPLLLIPFKFAVGIVMIPLVFAYILIELLLKTAFNILCYIVVYLSRNFTVVEALCEWMFNVLKLVLYFVLVPYGWLVKIIEQLHSIFRSGLIMKIGIIIKSSIQQLLKFTKKFIIKPLTKILLIVFAYLLGQSAEAFVKIWKIFWYSTDLSADLLVLIIDVYNQIDIIVVQLIKSPLFYFATAINPAFVYIGRFLLKSLKTMIRIGAILLRLLKMSFMNKFTRNTYKFMRQLFQQLSKLMKPIILYMIKLTYQIFELVYAIAKPIATIIYETAKIIKNLF